MKRQQPKILILAEAVAPWVQVLAVLAFIKILLELLWGG